MYQLFHIIDIIKLLEIEILSKHIFTGSCISSNKLPQSLVYFTDLRCSTYWMAALKRGRSLFQSQKIYSLEISERCNFLFTNNNK